MRTHGIGPDQGHLFVFYRRRSLSRYDDLQRATTNRPVLFCKGRVEDSCRSPVGHLTSTYSFINSVPREENKIPNRYIDPNYTGSIILKPCNAPLWANCLDMKCYVPPADPSADINVDRKAANYTICECSMVTDTPDFYMAASEGEASLRRYGDLSPVYLVCGICRDMNQGISVLKSYLAVHPTQDLAQQYTMPICEPCGRGI